MTEPTSTSLTTSRGRVLDFPVARGSLADLLRLLGCEGDASRTGSSLPLAVRRIKTDEWLYHQGVPAESIYFVRHGTFKVVRTTEDGYEQVLGFAGPAQLLGFDALGARNHPTAAVALDEASVFVVALRDLAGPGVAQRTLADAVCRAGSMALSRQADIADIMSAVGAEVRLARFLLHLSKQMEARGESPRRFVLRMSRRDIASYLAVAIETISRMFSVLAGWGLITVSNRDVEIVDMTGLQELALSTRRPIEPFTRALAGRRGSNPMPGREVAA